MPREFDIPLFYRSPIIATIKSARREEDRYKKDMSPSILDLGRIRFKLARHFGFCYGVENAIEIAYRAIDENPDRRVFLLSEMIHNPHVNQDLIDRGVRFIMRTDGAPLVPLTELRPKDVVIVPAFGTTVEMFGKLQELGINPQTYNTTCPFVEKVWNRSAQLGRQGYAVIIHGRDTHEETRATYSHARQDAPSLIIRDIAEAEVLARFIREEIDFTQFDEYFAGRYSEDFRPTEHLQRVGVVNQTTMLATETQAISNLLKSAIESRFGAANLKEHFADTRDTLCYATQENQNATTGMLDAGGDLALVVGGYNSSNTSHLVELLEERMPTFYIKDADEIIDEGRIRHLDLHAGVKITKDWLPELKGPTAPLEILVTSGASCPDAFVDQVLLRVAELCGVEDRIEAALEVFRLEPEERAGQTDEAGGADRETKGTVL
ncbi:MAG: 4-hydroxy-3-methylbut-2-enyl diphosphate reductase [Leptospirales bacterium]|jgi:4-hydroxy-3-methylbut-2-enyl diphosphate reductase